MTQSPSRRTPVRVPRIGDLIDLELALEEDRERPIEVLLARDARIGREILSQGDRESGEANGLGSDDRALLLAWLDRVRPTPESPGRAVEGLLRVLSLTLVVTGLVSGALAVAGWLFGGAGAPVNVVQLWPALVGVQLVLAISWVVVRLASSWIARTVEDGLSTWLPAAVGALVARFAKPALRQAWSRFRALDRVYRGLRFWRVTQLSQSFAVAFNVGALAALFFIPTVDDPAFGWRSRLMDAPELEVVASVVAAPWSAIWPEALPTRAEILATEDSSLARDRARAKPGGSELWAAWWPFLVASFFVYGLAPRVTLRIVAGWRTRRLLRGVAFDHEGCVRVRERLRRPLVDGRAEGDELAGGTGSSDESPQAVLELPDRVAVVRWAGVPLEADALRARLGAAHGVMVDRVETAGGLDLGGDDVALQGVRDAAAVLAVVEAWEAPDADYLDFLRKLRAVLAERTPLLVLPCELAVDGRPMPVEPRHLALWRRQLAGLADPWLRVEPFPAEESP